MGVGKAWGALGGPADGGGVVHARGMGVWGLIVLRVLQQRERTNCPWIVSFKGVTGILVILPHVRKLGIEARARSRMVSLAGPDPVWCSVCLPHCL